MQITGTVNLGIQNDIFLQIVDSFGNILSERKLELDESKDYSTTTFMLNFSSLTAQFTPAFGDPFSVSAWRIVYTFSSDYFTI